MIDDITTEIKSFLTDEEFIIWESRLENILLVNQLKYYKDKKEIINHQKFESMLIGSLCMDESIPGEIWKKYTSNGNYQISSFGRVKYNNKIVQQKDEEGKIGYLVLDEISFGEKLLKAYTYEMVAKTFLQKPQEYGYHIHHITNNGYDNSIGNLIYLSEEQHKKIHEQEKRYRNNWL